MRKLLLSSAVLAALALQGCANTTHVIDIAPKSEKVAKHYSNQHMINYSVKPFSTIKVGSIETAIGEHADILIGNNARDAMQQYLGYKLSEYGFEPNNGTIPETYLILEITNLSYVTKTISLKTQATITTEIQATIVKDGQNYKASFKSEKIDEYGSLPDKHAVQDDINALLGKSVDRVFNDSRLVSLLIQ